MNLGKIISGALCCLMLLFYMSFAKSQTSDIEVGAASAATETRGQPGRNSYELSGVVVNLTVSGFGRQFYERFTSLWQDNPLSERYTIAIRERANPRYGSQIFIEYEQRRVFQTFLSPSSSAIRTASENAVALVYENIIATDVQRLMFRDVDLGADEI